MNEKLPAALAAIQSTVDALLLAHAAAEQYAEELVLIRLLEQARKIQWYLAYITPMP